MQSTTGAVTIILIATHEEDISSSNNPSAHPNIVTKEKRNVMEHTRSSMVPQCTMLRSSFYFKILRFDEIWMGHSASQTAMHCRRSECVLFCFKIEEKKILLRRRRRPPSNGCGTSGGSGSASTFRPFDLFIVCIQVDGLCWWMRAHNLLWSFPRRTEYDMHNNNNTTDFNNRTQCCIVVVVDVDHDSFRLAPCWLLPVKIEIYEFPFSAVYSVFLRTTSILVHIHMIIFFNVCVNALVAIMKIHRLIRPRIYNIIL